jgi:hypothetical protein
MRVAGSLRAGGLRGLFNAGSNSGLISCPLSVSARNAAAILASAPGDLSHLTSSQPALALRCFRQERPQANKYSGSVFVAPNRTSPYLASATTGLSGNGSSGNGS